ncbi:helix-turn-helix transcriptional regulator, partial [Pseudomonas aeruginosa]
ERVAAATGVCGRHLARRVAREGRSPGRSLQERRLERARQLLASPLGRRLDVAEVASRHGFSSQAHIARAYKARYGMTPSEAR